MAKAKKVRAGQRGAPSALSARARAIFERTKAARAELDAKAKGVDLASLEVKTFPIAKPKQAARPPRPREPVPIPVMDPLHVAKPKQAARPPRPREPVPIPVMDPLHVTLDQVTRAQIEQALIACKGNISRAAKSLGLHRQALQRLIRRLSPARENYERSPGASAVVL